MSPGRQAVVANFGLASRVVQIVHPTPEALPADHVRIRMKCVAINPSDLITISGAYRSRVTLPFLPGFEGVGTVIETGSDCCRLQVGQRVIPIAQSGLWQDVKVSPENRCLVVPDGISDEEACTSYINPMTAWIMLKEQYNLRAGSTIGISAAGPAIGKMIAHLAISMGIQPIMFFRSLQAAKNLEHLTGQKYQYKDIHDLTGICDNSITPKVDIFLIVLAVKRLLLSRRSSRQVVVSCTTAS